MRDVPTPEPAAWAPWAPGERDWLLRREALAVEWLVREAAAAGTTPVIQGKTQGDGYHHGHGPLAALAKRADLATYRSPAGPGPTYVHFADIRLLACAMSTADGQSIVVTETPTFPLHGWAMAVGAVNVATNEVTVDDRTPEQVELVEQLVDQLYNGWSHKQVGRRASAYVMPKLVESGMTYAVFVGSVVAMDPRHLDSNPDIEAMKQALPPEWEAERRALSESWRMS